jgi:hypothetical protein
MTAGTTNRHRRTVRRAAACASVAAAIATGGYAATPTFAASYHSASPAASRAYVRPSPDAMRELVETVQALYGPTRGRIPSLDGTVRPNHRVGRSLREVAIGLYGHGR